MLLVRDGAAAGRVGILFLFHAAIFATCYILAWLLRFDFAVPPAAVTVIKSSLQFVVLTQLLVITALGMLRGWWRYVGISDAIRLVGGMAAALLVLLLWWYTTGTAEPSFISGVSRAVLLIDWAFAVLALFGARVLVRISRDLTRGRSEDAEPRRVLIVGAGDAGEALAREIQHRPQLRMRIVAFVDDDRAKWRSHIRGIEVRGPISSVTSIAEDLEANEALLAMPSATGQRVREILRQLADARIQFRTVPGLDQLATGKVQVTQLRQVNVDDLLRRKQTVVAPERIRELFNGRRIVVTGAGGSVGSELVLQILDYEPTELHLIERSELALYQCEQRIEREKPWARHIVIPHLLDCERAGRLLVNVQPAVVVHAAAHKHVPIGEQNAAEYVRNNCVVARRLAEACETAGVERFVFISTDKAIHPISAMGASKRAAEIALLNLAARTEMRIMVVRFGNIIGSSGSVVPRFLDQIAAGGPVTVTHPDVTRYFLRTTEAISLVLQAVALGEPGRIYMLEMGEPIRIVDLARDLIQLSNHTLDEIPIVFTGLRPGEKLREDIQSTAEVISPTAHPQIMSIDAAVTPEIDIEEWYRRLESAAATDTPVLPILQEMVPEFGTGAEAESSVLVPDSSRDSAPLRLVN